ncbi:hypothetical protein [Longivirga aurantiaca]|uniref:Uncharacterized protein n=1 Tax=Longivirga aurantiaca TaxID=1837743 RepID=A0ABW1SZE5_9ACTN
MSHSRENASTIVLMGFLGVLLGLVGSVVSAARVQVGSVTVPWGALLAALTLAVAVRAVVWSSRTRLQGAVLLGGWVVATSVVLLVSPGGDVLLPGVPRSYVYLGSAFVLGLAALVWRLPEGHGDLIESEAALVPGDSGAVLPSGDLPEPSGEGPDVR